MTWYAEDKKQREHLINSLTKLCKSHDYELNEEQLKELKKMKFYDLSVLVLELSKQLGQRHHEVFIETNRRIQEAIEKIATTNK